MSSASTRCSRASSERPSSRIVPAAGGASVRVTATTGSDAAAGTSSVSDTGGKSTLAPRQPTRTRPQAQLSAILLAGVLQLANVAGPIVRLERQQHTARPIGGGGRPRRRKKLLRGCARSSGKSSWRSRSGGSATEHVQPVVEVLAESAFYGRHLLKIAIGRRRRRARRWGSAASRRAVRSSGSAARGAASPACSAGRRRCRRGTACHPARVSNRPGRATIAPVNAPRSVPNSSDSISVSANSAQLNATKGLWRRGLCQCSALATTSLPVPLSPVTSTLPRPGPMSARYSKIARMRGLDPMTIESSQKPLRSSAITPRPRRAVPAGTAGARSRRQPAA